jgi:hypothetical protein
MSGAVGGVGTENKLPFDLEGLVLQVKDQLLDGVPEADRESYDALLTGVLSEKPELAVPLMTSGLSLEVLMEAIGAEERRTGVKTATESLKAKAEDRKDLNDKALAQIKERLDTLAKEKTLSPFLKAFKYIGMALGAIASIATIAVGVATGNPLMIGAGVLMAALVVDSIVSEATEGKHGIAAWTAEIAKACGADEETAKWIGFATTMALTVVSICLSFGAAGASSAAKVADSVVNVLVKVQQAATVASGVVAMANGASKIAQAVFDYEIADSKAVSKQLEAILERLKESIETEEDFLKFLVENFESIMSQIGDMVKAGAEAQMEIAAGGSPAMA